MLTIAALTHRVKQSYSDNLNHGKQAWTLHWVIKPWVVAIFVAAQAAFFAAHTSKYLLDMNGARFSFIFKYIFFTPLTLNCHNGVSGILKQHTKLLLSLLQHSSDVCSVTLSLKHEAGFSCGMLKTFCCLIFHRPPLKDLCWSRPKKSPCDPKTWRECSRTMQRTSWSGSQKVEVSWIKKTWKHVLISVFLRFFWWIPSSAQILGLHSLSGSCCFLLFFIIQKKGVDDTLTWPSMISLLTATFLATIWNTVEEKTAESASKYGAK